MDITRLSHNYTVRFLTDTDIVAIYELSAGNPLFYQYCPPFVTRQSIIDDMKALPPNKSYEDKYYIGFFKGTKLAAIMDLILSFPDPNTAFIGLFMVNKSLQRDGIGSSIIADISAYIRSLGYSRIHLGFAKGNPQSEAFWKKNGFVKTGVETQQDTYIVISMQKEL